MSGVDIPQTYMPMGWMQSMVKNQEVGGVMFIFPKAKTKKLLQQKVRRIKEFCRKLEKEFKSSAVGVARNETLFLVPAKNFQSLLQGKISSFTGPGIIADMSGGNVRMRVEIFED